MLSFPQNRKEWPCSILTSDTVRTLTFPYLPRRLAEGRRKLRTRAVPVVAQWLMNPTGNHEVAGSVPGLAQWVIAVSWGVGGRRSSDLVLLWLWRGPVATAPIQPLASEPPYAKGVALEMAKDQKKKKKKLRICDEAGLTLVWCSGRVSLSASPKVDHGWSGPGVCKYFLLRAK